MTTFVPRPPYSKEELELLYPKDLQLQLVQIVSHYFILPNTSSACSVSLDIAESQHVLVADGFISCSVMVFRIRTDPSYR